MWPFRRRRASADDHHAHTDGTGSHPDDLTREVDLAPLGPFREAERYLVVWPNSLSECYALVIVYEGRRGGRVHIVHSPGYAHGGGLQTHAEWLGTVIRQRDPAATAILEAWPSDQASTPPGGEMTRVWFTPSPTGLKSLHQLVVMSEGEGGAPEVDNVYSKERECFYADAHFESHDLRHWENLLGCSLPTFTAAGWERAAETVDPGRVRRQAVEDASRSAYDAQIALMKELGVYGDEDTPEPPDGETKPLEPSAAQRARLMECWAHEPTARTAQISGFTLGIGKVENPHPAPVVQVFLTPEDADELGIDLHALNGLEKSPPEGLLVRFWDETLLTVEKAGEWRLVLYLERSLLPRDYFESAAVPSADRPPAVVAVTLCCDGSVIPKNEGMSSMVDLGDAVFLAHLEDCRELGPRP